MRGEELNWSQFTPYGITTGIVTLFATAFHSHFWKLRFLQDWLVKRPDLSGTWECRLQSNFKLGESAVDKIVYAVIRQNLSSLHFYLYTERAHSVSIADTISSDGAGLFSLTIVYRNTPDIDQRDAGEFMTKSQIHFGSAHFTNISYSAPIVSGHYWTDRNTNGKLMLLKRHKSLVESYDAAQRLFSQPT